MTKETQPVVGVVMGSDSDMEVVKRCLDQLSALDIAYEVRVISAHRTPEVAREYSASAVGRGLKVIVAAAGMSAALAGVLASHTTLPVIGVPVNSGPLDGVDAAVSTLQMPPGVPVGCMSIGSAGAVNAAVYAAQILATADEALAARLGEFKKKQAETVARKDAGVRKQS